MNFKHTSIGVFVGSIALFGAGSLLMTSPSHVVVTSENAPIHQDPVSAPKPAYIPRGTILPIIYQRGWRHVEFTTGRNYGQDGWIWSEVGDHDSVTAPRGCSVRSGPSNTAERIFTGDHGDKFRGIKRHTFWYEVKGDGKVPFIRGWINRIHVKHPFWWRNWRINWGDGG